MHINLLYTHILTHLHKHIPFAFITKQKNSYIHARCVTEHYP